MAVPEGRRTGITFGTMLDKTLVAAARQSAGGDNVFYIGDTKEKGLEAIGYCAKFARVIAQAQGQGVSGIEEFLFEDQDDNGKTKHITAYRIRFSSGFQVCALSSRPANIRGLQGQVVIDEAAFHPDVQGVLDAATALLIWGGKITVISSHNGKGNAFNQFCNDIEAGRYGPDARVVTVTFDDAVGNGLYERVCMMKGDKPTLEGKEAWYTKIRNAYGARKTAMREELDAIPRDGNGVCLPGVWIDNAMNHDGPVLRMVLDDDFVKRSLQQRVEYAAEWIERKLYPALSLCDPSQRHVYGMDFARHRNFSHISPLAISRTLRRKMPFAVELQNVPTRQQEQILWALIDGLPLWSGGSMDAGGSGETIAEYTADKYGHNRIAQIKLSRSWYGLWMPKMTKLFEDGVIDLLRDDNLQQDLRSVEEVDGTPMVIKANQRDLKDPALWRHGDGAISLCLANHAAVELNVGPVHVASRGRRNAQTLLQGY